jgi:hypothetical protein
MVSKNPVIDSNKLERGVVWGETDSTAHWVGAFAVYGGHGATAFSTIVYEIEPGKRSAGTLKCEGSGPSLECLLEGGGVG